MFNFYKIPTKHTHIFSGVVREEWIDYIEQRKVEGDYFQIAIAFILSKGYAPEEALQYIKLILDKKEKEDGFYK